MDFTSIPVPVYLFLALIAACYMWDFMEGRTRAKQIQRYAQSVGFTYSGSALPADFPLAQCDLYATFKWQDLTIHNAAMGTWQGKEILFFDWKATNGETGSAGTILAFRGNDRKLWIARLDCTLKTEQVDNWTLLFREYQLPIGEIQALMSGLS
jgi:hypothetical protein